MRGRPLVLGKTDTGCIVPLSHKLNQDGYFRYTIRKLKGRGARIMYHRYVWEQANGEIPEGYEVDHICRNRACCNLEHLQLLEGTEHTIKTNKERYSGRKEEAKKYWMQHNCTGTFLASMFNVSFSIGCKWIRGWKV